MKKLLLASLLSGISCAAVAGADTIFYNAKVYTVNESQPWAEAFAVQDGKFVAVGTLEQLRKYQDSKTKLVDLQQKFVMPGIVDEHIHPDMGADNYMNIFISPTDNWEKVTKTLLEYRKNHPDKKWIYGGNLNWLADNGEFIAETNIPSHKSSLDAIISDHPVALYDQGAHAMLLNTMALKELKIDRNTPVPKGSVVVKDKDGEPTGVIRESITDWVSAALDNPPNKEWADKGMLPFLQEMHSYGVTTMTDAYGSPRNFETYHYLEQKGELNTRMNVCIASPLNYPSKEGKAAQQKLIDNYQSLTTDLVSAHCIKYIMDGSAAGQTAVMLEPFTNSNFSGNLRISEADVQKEMKELDKKGFVFKAHAIGDRAIRVMLDSFEQLPVHTDGRHHSVAHGTFIHPDDFSRFSKLNAVYEASPALWFPNPGLEVIGKDIGDRVRRMWPIKQLLNKGTLVSYGSDWTVSFSPDPWLAIETIVTREKPGGSADTAFDFSAIPIDQAIKIFTLNGAKAIGMGNELGSIEAGKYADFIVLNQDIFHGEVRKIHNTIVDKTYFNGKQIYPLSK